VLTKWKIPIILAVAAAAIAGLLFAGATSNDLYMTSLEQWDAPRARRESVRVMGFVKEGSISLHPDALVTEFVMRSGTGETVLPVKFKGVTPALFRDGTNVIASGRLGDDGVFKATELMTKCPSKYEGMETPHGEMGTVPPLAVSPSMGM
jgi:cytochrome c-type biogenesis protein CcmE